MISCGVVRSDYFVAEIYAADNLKAQTNSVPEGKELTIYLQFVSRTFAGANIRVPGRRIVDFVGLVRIVARAVQTAGFVALQRAENDNFGDLNQIAQLEQACLDLKIPVILVDFLFEHLDTT